MSDRSWYRLHWMTWVVLIVVGGALVLAQCVVQGSAAIGGSYHVDTVHWHGFPFEAVWHIEHSKTSFLAPKISTSTHEFAWNIFGLIADIIFAAIAIASVGIVVQTWCRSKQITLRTLLAIPPIAGLLLSSRSLRLSGQYPLWSFIDWYLAVPLVFGIGCTIYSAGWLAVGSFGWLLMRISRRGGTEIKPNGTTQSPTHADWSRQNHV